MKKIIAFLLIAVSFIGITSCDSHSSKINGIEETLLWGENGKVGTWGMSYNYDFVDDIELTAVETMTLKDNGKFTEETIYYYNGHPMAKGTMTGEWDIEYNDDLDAYFFNQYYDDKLSIKNLNMNEDWFKRFDTDLRLIRRGDAYDSVEDEDDDKIYGIEIIDCNKNLFLVKSLGTGTVYRYEPVGKTEVRQDTITVPSGYDQEGDPPCEDSYTLRGKIGDYPIEMELSAFEENIIDARYRYLKTGSGEWINLEIERDDLGRTIMYESLDGKRVGRFQGRFTVSDNEALYEGWHTNLVKDKDLTFYIKETL